MILYEHPMSSYAQKVKIALREKGVAFETLVPEDLGHGKDGKVLGAANPRGEVPVLLPDGQAPIFESTVIMEYIEERWPAPPLLHVQLMRTCIKIMRLTGCAKCTTRIRF